MNPQAVQQKKLNIMSTMVALFGVVSLVVVIGMRLVYETQTSDFGVASSAFTHVACTTKNSASRLCATNGYVCVKSSVTTTEQGSRGCSEPYVLRCKYSPTECPVISTAGVKPTPAGSGGSFSSTSATKYCGTSSNPARPELTSPAGASLSAATKVKTGSSTTGSVKLTWKAPTRWNDSCCRTDGMSQTAITNARSQVIYYRGASCTGAWKTAKVSATASTYTLKNLKVGDTFCWRVYSKACSSSSTSGTGSTVKYFKTAQ